MSETVLKILTSELKTIRIKCRNKKCGAIVEGDVGDIHKLMSEGKCKFCNQSFRQGNEHPVIDLARAINVLAGMEETLQVEFVVPEKD
jgi:hypothetical protein